MRPSELHALIRKELRGSISSDALSAADNLPSAMRLAIATWRERLQVAAGGPRQLVAPSGSLDWMAPAVPGERQPSGA